MKEPQLDSGHLPPAAPEDVSEMRASLAKGNAILFLGSGPSCALGAPSWSKLQESILKEFIPAEERAEAGKLDWWTLLDTVCDTLGRRTEVEQWVQAQLGGATVEPWLRTLLDLPWVMTFTTNYDDLPERLNHEAAGRGHHFRGYYGGRLPSLPTPPGETPIVKMMGDLRERHPSPGAMVLGTSDRTTHNSSRQYVEAVRLFREHLDAGRDVVVVGQSLSDGILMTVMNDVTNLRGAKADGRIFLCTTSTPNYLATLALKKFNGKHHRLDGAAVARLLDGTEGPAPAASTRRIQLAGRTISIGRHAESQLHGLALILDSQSEGHSFDTQENFLARSAYSRQAFRNHWDFLRQLCKTSSDARIISRTATVTDLMSSLRDPTKPRASALLVGPPGAAKTMTALRLAHDWTNANGVVVLAEARPYAHDAARLAAGVAGLCQDILADPQTEGKMPTPGVLVIIDEASRDTRFLERFREACRIQHASDFRLLVVGHPPVMERYRTSFDSFWDLPASLEPGEVAALRTYVRGLASPPSEDLANLVLANSASQTFWHVFYQLVSPTRQPLEQTIVKYAEARDAWKRELAHVVALCEALEVPVPVAVLHRLSNDKGRAEIVHDCTKGELGQILYIDEGPLDCVRFINRPAAEALCVAWRTRGEASSLLSSVVLLAETAQEQKVIGDGLVKSLTRHPRNIPEGSFLATMLPMNDRELLVGRFADKFPSPTTLMQHAKLLRRRHMYEDAIWRLDSAMAMADNSRDRQNIHHGLAISTARQAKRLADLNRKEDAVHMVERCESHLGHLATDRLSYKYSAESEFLEAKSMTADGELARALLWRSLHSAKYSRLFAKDPEAKDIADDMVSRLSRRLGDEAMTWDEAKELAKVQREASGYLHVADSRLGELPWSIHSPQVLREVLAKLHECLHILQKDGMVSLYAARLTILLDPTDRGIDDLLDAALTDHLDDDVLALRALLAACREKRRDFDHYMGLLRERPEASIQANARPDFVIRGKSGPTLFEVRGGSPNWIQIMGGRELAPDWPAGDRVLVEVSMHGLLLRHGTDGATSAAPFLASRDAGSLQAGSRLAASTPGK